MKKNYLCWILTLLDSIWKIKIYSWNNSFSMMILYITYALWLCEIYVCVCEMEKKKQWKRKGHQKEWIKKKVGSLVWKIQKSISMWP